ncbi:tripartite motif-containing protein 45 [Exaiptasia diaphana]|uniref:Uncharacterized protein n=1 Tax=Exaiptasia diaphana TaxID=2652724 RepID=A0A913YCL2_EXADI|nr:tripartite motif-containing protein 45 [Exaiptasia diaphana]
MESFLEGLKLQVQCSLCNDIMFEPKLLQCFHTFCKTCIKTNAQLDGQVNIFKCPQCTSLTELQELNEVEDLEISPIHSRIIQVLLFIENQKVCSVSASHSNASFQCLDCDRSLCDECLNNHSIFTKDHKVVSLSEMTKEDIQSMLKKETPCKSHVNQDVKLYCSDCNELICQICLIELHHNSHKMISLQEFIAAQKDDLSRHLKEIENMDTNENEKKQQEQIAVDIKRDGQKAQKQVKRLTKQLKKKIDNSEEELLNTIQKSMTKANRNLRIILHSPAAKEYMKYLIQNGTASEIIATRSDTECSKAVAYSTFNKDLGGMKFQPNEQLCEQVDSGVGLIQAFKRADPNNSLLQAVGENGFEAMKKTTLKVTIKNYKDELCNPPPDDVTIHITPEDDVKVGKKQVTADGQIKVNFTPRVPGQLTAEVQVHGSPVSNSPLVMDVKPQHIVEMTKITKLKEALNTGSKNFTGIAVNKSNTEIAVADWKACCVRVFNMDGDLLLSYRSKDRGQGKKFGPLGLAFLNETELVIADYNNHRICILSSKVHFTAITVNASIQSHDQRAVHGLIYGCKIKWICCSLQQV